MKPQLKNRVEPPAADILEYFHPLNKICTLPETGFQNAAPFSSFRPQPGTFVDYQISQTDTKLDAIDTKIHLRQTEATYELLDPQEIQPPPPPKIKRCKYFSGGPPQWDFIDEIWRRKQEDLQKFYHSRLASIRHRRIQALKKQMRTGFRMFDKAGPQWFQELSPEQLRTVDDLKRCIVKDVRDRTITNTQENIANLGLVLRPNHNHIRAALLESCKCPVEFLLVLYQLINPKRSQYSLNDRLLLSAVVHLAMKDTLRELHVRIPSPPKAPPQVLPKPKKPKPLTYDSPYLVPYTFKPQPSQFTGIYYNKHLQHPESPYFNYLNDFNTNAPDIASLKPINPIDKEIIEELKLAQQMYSSLVNFQVRTLLKPSVRRPCFNFRSRLAIKLCQDFDAVEKTSSTLFIMGNIKMTASDGAIPHIQGVGKYRKPKIKICRTKVHVPDDNECQCRPNQKRDVCVSTCGDTQQNTAPCACKPPNKKKMADNVFVITGVKVTASGTMLPVIEGVTKWRKMPCPCALRQDPADISFRERFKMRDDTRTTLMVPAKPEPPECACKKAALELDCPCDKCREDRERNNRILHIHGLKETESDDTVPVIEGTEQLRPCQCLKKYETKTQKYDDYANRQQLLKDMQAQDSNYIISGVVNTAGGPVYVLSGIKPSIEKRTIQDPALPTLPPGRVKYEISGVRTTPEGNVFVLRSALPIEDCGCMKLYTSFKKQHMGCLRMYDDFLKRMTECVNNYMDELKDENYIQEPEQPAEVPADESVDKQDEENPCALKNESFDVAIPKLGEQNDENDCVCAPKENSRVKVAPSCCEVPLPPPDKCSCTPPEPKPPKLSCEDCTCGDPDEEPPEPMVEVPDQVLIKRFVIIDKIPCNPKAQLDLIKKALTGMAEDGYPLAKLPDAYKLPHFKLWMQMRCGKFWTQAEKRRYVQISKKFWRTVDYCRAEVQKPKLPLSKSQIEGLNWTHAERYKQLVADQKETYYRKVKQAAINFNRAFFPTTFSYEFPFSTFRDCFFAYSASKEESLPAAFVWQPYEIKDFKNRQSCLC